MRLSRVPAVLRAGIAASLFAGVLTLSGCGKSTGNVSGKVMFKGAPLKGGTIGFIDANGKSKGAALDENGTFKITGLVVGEYAVTVETESLRPKDGGGSGPPPGMKKGQGAPPKDAQLPDGYVGSNPASAASANAMKFYVPIPGIYAKKETTNLKHTVVSGDNPPVEFEIKQ